MTPALLVLTATVAGMLRLPGFACTSDVLSVASAVHLEEREPLGLIVVTPSAERAKIGVSSLLRGLSEALRAHTAFRLVELESELAIRCEGRLACVIRGLRSPAPRFLILISKLTQTGAADRLSVLVVHVERAVEILRTVEEDPEAAIGEAAVPVRRFGLAVETEADVQAVLRTLVEEDLRRAFEASGDWDPFGTIEVQASVAGAEIQLDGTSVGATAQGVTRLEAARPGSRRLSLRRADRVPFDATVEVRRCEVAKVVAELAPLSDAPLRTATLWSGALLAATGVGLAIFAAARHDPGLQTLCIDGPPDCARTRFDTFGYDPSRRGSVEVNPGGVAVVPLALALIVAGGTWVTGAMWFGAPEDAPWLATLIGAGLGGATYGIAAAF